MNAKFTQLGINKSMFQSKKDDRKGTDVVCAYCKFTGQFEDKCFALHDYPEWHRLYEKPKPKIRNQAIKKGAANFVNSKPDTSSCKDELLSADSSPSSSLSEAQC